MSLNVIASRIKLKTCLTLRAMFMVTWCRRWCWPPLQSGLMSTLDSIPGKNVDTRPIMVGIRQFYKSGYSLFWHCSTVSFFLHWQIFQLFHTTVMLPSHPDPGWIVMISIFITSLIHVMSSGHRWMVDTGPIPLWPYLYACHLQSNQEEILSQICP